MAVAVGLAVLGIWAINFEYPRVVSEHGLWDFGAFIASGRAAASGLDPYGIYPPLTPHVVFPGFEAWNPNLNPPISAILFQLFDIADHATSLRVWWVISLFCYLGAVLLLLRRYSGGLEAVLLGVWAFALAGFWDTLYLGQIYTPLVLATVAAWLLLDRGRYVQAGILIGLLVSMKPNFLVWPVLLFLAAHWRPVVAAAVTAAVVAAVPLAVFGPQIYLDWLALVASDGERAIFLTNASFAGLASRAGLPLLGTVLGAVLLLSLAAWSFWRRPQPMDVSSFALLAALLASPLGWIHYTLFLLPVLFHHWRSPWTWPVAVALTMPVPLVLADFGKPALTQLTTGSIYAWSLVLLLVGLMAQQRCNPTLNAAGRSSNSPFA
ncbi:DUF2029 domain-containing protein [Rhizobium sp. TRM95001]|nr:DUF2029 domain-containing protein [Rhizobium halophilum]